MVSQGAVAVTPVASAAFLAPGVIFAHAVDVGVNFRIVAFASPLSSETGGVLARVCSSCT